MSDNLVLDVRGLSKSYPGFELSDVSFQMRSGEIMGFIGQNGAGKTTTIKMIMNLIAKESGEVEFFGLDHIKHEREIKSRIGFLFEDRAFYMDLSVNANKNIFSKFYPDWNDQLFYEYLERFSIDPKKTPRELSKGMKTKFNLAFVLSHDPELIIMDEPTSGLDPVFRDEFLELLVDLVKSQSKSIFFSSHITPDLEKAADVVTYIHNGKIIFSKPKSRILESYYLVRGPETILNDSIAEELSGLKKGEFGFSGLTEDEQFAKKVEAKGGIIGNASLDDIMVYTTRKYKSQSL